MEFGAGEWPDLIALGWSGWSSFDAKVPYWGRVGQTADYRRRERGFVILDSRVIILV